MTKALSWILLVFLFSTNGMAQEDPKKIYIEKYADIAISEMQRTGIPASIKLAQGILESNAGRSVLAKEAKNHFGIKCGKDWTGPTYLQEDDDYDDKGQLLKSCFRKYKDPESSYIAHSEFLRDPAKVYRYGPLFRLDPHDYKGWANGLKTAGYATNPNYPIMLINLIEDYQLYKFDDQTMADSRLPVNRKGIRLINDVKVVISQKGESLFDISSQYDVSLKNLQKYNEKIAPAPNLLPENTPVFIQKKRWFFRGRQKWHYVKEGETMYSISQLYGIQLKRLYCKNRIPYGSEPAIGEKVKLGFWWVKKSNIPKIKPKNQQANSLPTSNPSAPPPTRPDTLHQGNKPPVTTTPGNNPPAGTTKPGSDKDGQLDFEIIPGAVVDPGTQNNNTKPPVTTPPVDTTTTKPGNTNNNPTTPSAQEFYTVMQGDTLYGISRRFSTTVENLRTLNKLDSINLKPGQILRVK